MGVAEFFVGLIMIGTVVVLVNKDKWASDNRISPPGKKMDYNSATTDILTKGKDYYYKKHLSGGYDIPDDK